MSRICFNISVRSGKVPTEQKQAKCIPLHKSRNHDDTSNYNKISMSNCMSTGAIIFALIGPYVNHFQSLLVSFSRQKYNVVSYVCLFVLWIMILIFGMVTQFEINSSCLFKSRSELNFYQQYYIYYIYILFITWLIIHRAHIRSGI